MNLRERKSQATIAKEMLHLLENSVPYSTTFIHQIPKEVREEVEKELKRKFEIWANSWIAPGLRRIILKGQR